MTAPADPSNGSGHAPDPIAELRDELVAHAAVDERDRKVTNAALVEIAGDMKRLHGRLDNREAERKADAKARADRIRLVKEIGTTAVKATGLVTAIAGLAGAVYSAVQAGPEGMARAVATVTEAAAHMVDSEPGDTDR